MRWVVEYINWNGNVSKKSYDNEYSALSFTEQLDERIKKGVCGGYIVTPMEDRRRRRLSEGWLSADERARIYG